MKLPSSDPSYWMLAKGLKEQSETPDKFEWRTKTEVYSDTCYICNDPEFALMGLPLCFPCKMCGGHVSADDTVCDECGYDNNPYYPDEE